jgi:hypothetical protein
MIAITTSNSMSVKPSEARQLRLPEFMVLHQFLYVMPLMPRPLAIE